MSKVLDSEKIKNQFENHLRRVFLDHFTLILTLGAVFLSYYILSDWSVRQNYQAVLIRSAPMALIIVLLLLHFVSRHRFYRLKRYLYIALYLALQLMMYAKCLLHLYDDALAPSVTGAILVIFLISLDAKENKRWTAFIFGLPILLFTLVLIFIAKPGNQEFLIIADIYPITVIGFVINRVQYNLRFKLFKTNKLLLNEQNKTKNLYSESLSINSLLEQKAIEARTIKEEIEEKNEELKKLNAAKDKFLGIIAHDLKNPIGNICGLSDLLLVDKHLNGKETGQLVELINDSIWQTHSLLDNLLNWARAKGDSMSFLPEDHNAKDLVEKELQALRLMAAKKSISVQNNIPADFRVFADRNMFETIVRNLVANAIKFTPLNGAIEINAQFIENESRFLVELSVADNGVGMTAELASKLFVFSRQTSTKGTNNEEGTGLGLLLCKEFMDIHNGVIDVDSKPGKGSVFKCLFPVS
jgi:signal transduction histidine kinase